MSSNKGGRPAHHDGQIKKAAIAVRTAPSIRDALKAAADVAGRSITQEVEARLAASFDRDSGVRSPETERLLNRIGAEIADIEAATGKHWHRDRKTAGAVMEMLEKGARRWIRTDDPYEDEFVQAAWEKLNTLRLEREKVISSLGELGINATSANTAAVTQRKGIFGSLSQEVFKGRWYERRQLDALDTDASMKAALAVILDQLETMDSGVDAAEAKYSEQVQPYIEAELDGRRLYRERRRQKAEEARARGEPFDYADWMI